MDIIRELMNTLLPVPVEPAINKCGMAARSVIRMRPCKSRPIASVNLLGEFTNSGASRISRSAIVCRLRFGTSIPIVDFPGMRSIRIDSACSARHKSSVSPVMRVYLNVKFQAFLLDRARPLLQLHLIQFVAALALAQQGRGRQLIARAALCNLGLSGLLCRSFLRFAVEHKNRRSLRGVRRFLFVLFLDSGPVPENVAFIS